MGRPRKYADAAAAAEANRQRAAEKSRERGRQGKEIGPLPPPENLERRESCKLNLQLFLETYFPDIFRNEWSEAHLQLISDLQNCILYGQNSICVLPRGFGKSSITSLATLWAVLYGHRNYAVIVAASASMAKRILLNIRNELLFNPLLGCQCGADTPAKDYTATGDFPEVTIPYRRIGSAAQRQGCQTVDGELTRCVVAADRLVLPTIPNSSASGAVIQCSGFNGSIRGLNISTSKGSLRPDLLVLDDIQSDASAKNPRRVAEQLTTLNGTLKGLSGVDSTIATIAALTVIEPNDLAEQLLKSPEWRSTRFGVIDKLPGDRAMEEWSKLNQLQGELIEKGLNDAEIAEQLNKAFEDNKEVLMDGCKPTWSAFKDPLDCHAMQKIMRLLFSDFNVFCREYMNNPSLSASAASEQLTADQLAKKVLPAYKRNVIPLETEYLTLGADSQTLGLFYCVIAHTADGSAYVIDYGKYPKSLKKTLPQQYNGLPLDASIYAGYKDLLSDLMNRKYIRPDGLELQIGKAVLDCSHGPTSLKIQQFIRDFGDSRIQPLFGRAKNPDELIFGKKKPGELRGKGWSMPPVRKIKGSDGRYMPLPRHVIVDVNSWKSTLRAGLQASPGVIGSIGIFNDSLQNHAEYFLHLTAERSSPLSGKYGTIDSWKLLPNRANHYLDATVYALAAGSMLSKIGGGISNPKLDAQFNSRKRVRLSEIQKNKGVY